MVIVFFCRFWKEMGLILFHQNLNGLWMQMQCTSLRISASLLFLKAYTDVWWVEVTVYAPVFNFSFNKCSVHLPHTFMYACTVFRLVANWRQKVLVVYYPKTTLLLSLDMAWPRNCYGECLGHWMWLATMLSTFQTLIGWQLSEDSGVKCKMNKSQKCCRR